LYGDINRKIEGGRGLPVGGFALSWPT